MTHFLQRSVLQRSALILLATSALCVTPALAKTHHHAKKPAASHADQAERVSYTVKKGDTLAMIADKLDTTVDELMKDNKLKKTSVLQPGQVLKGPVVAKTSAKAGGASSKPVAKTYKVVRGDTLYSISQRQHVSMEDLRAANGLSAKGHIHAGQELRLPGGEETAEEAPSKAKSGKGAKGRLSPAEAEDAAVSEHAAAGRVITVQGKGSSYKARKGDTLAKIAGKLDTDVAELKRLNHIKGTAVRAGQVYHGPAASQHVYTAVVGDTLAGIAQRFGVSVERLRAANHLPKRAKSVRPGQKVYLPAGYHDHSAPSEERPSRSYPQPYPRHEDSTTLPSHPIPYAPSGQTPRPFIPPPGANPESAPNATPAPTDAQISQMGKGRFQWPIRGEILSDFGAKPGGQRNDGIDIQAEAGAAVRSAADGDVVYAGDQVPGFGNLVLIKHADGWVTAYGHLSRTEVKMQQKVTQGQEIGQAGNSGGVPEPQLHFEVRYAPNPAERARPVDPKLVLPK
jgi:murein DD-endopeptidase MepM/ murein hydrolase activator NlpD